ncbi:hypothetical protein HOF67_02640 [Candidatus Peregrinibacteria bacterium]|jgi:hypothetical protein|nr:hypothetical protein [Candidatus Peregrinibacteria bacterium]
MENKTSPWVVIFTIILTAAVVGGGMYFWQNQSVDEVEVETEQEALTEVNELKYENQTYGFAITFPNEWAEVEEEIKDWVLDIEQSKNIRITAENDIDRFIEIRVVKIDDKDNHMVADAPHTYIMSNSEYSFFYTGGGSYAGMPGMEDQKYFDIQNEVEDIIKTFEVL